MTTKLAVEMARIASACPVDPLRPHIQLKTLLNSLAAHPRLTPGAVNAAQRLERNEMQQKYALSERILRPASVPLHYEKLVEGVEKSMQGIKRPWWKVFFGIW
ncbi:hypothetical protein HMN09_00309900 [Mycena chlorophos]|uniref:Uncharacterized protein n=2 Tax=Mycena chlorophos TaxID=658473 RepID=A0A146IBH3_MYCCL|nr:hypothetical protein HMN09_00486700 [Mycena chlorophos]KAF7318026.1 hypothetical protein HMN09_00309900 [Mycena chlorophos]GAT57251.1 predicted protein [Mycena chlorophos]